MLSIWIPGPPVAKGRPRVTRRGATYTPAKTRTWEGMARTFGLQAMAGKPLLNDPLRLRVSVLLAVPRSWPQWKRAAAIAQEIAPTGKPDAENCAKALCDALTGVVYVDDAQICELWIGKRYAEAPGVLAEVTVLDKQAMQTARRVA